ncbi:MAG TPA: hypothetical protein VJL29_06330 [Thermoguttaceae bacterium]|nr:hypothetical protein [Thermoguttaceae bacterium]
MILRDWLVPRPEAAAMNPLRRAGITPGLYHYLRESGGETVRFHLRVDATGGGLLVAGGAAAARLRPSGVIIAKAALEGKQPSAIASELLDLFRGVTADEAATDVRRVREIIAQLESPGDNYPILNLTDPAFAPGAAPLARPLSADVPAAEPERIVPLIDRLWQLAIPHVTFIAGPRTDPRWLVRAVERSEDLGMIAGVRIRGTDLLRDTLLAELATAGVDHVDVLYLSHEPAVHDALAGQGDHAQATAALARLRDREICAVAQVALVGANASAMEETLRALTARNVTNAAWFAVVSPTRLEGPLSADALVQSAARIEESAEELGLRLLWYPPVRFDASLSLAEQVRRGPRASGDTAVRVEPDGTVIPPRGPWLAAGNFMTEDWETIRRRPSYRAYRHRIETDTHCDACPGLAVCAADCPRDPAGWADNRGIVEMHA